MRIRIHNTRQSKYYYALTKGDARRVVIVGAVGLIALVLLVVGFWFFASQSLFIALLCIPFFVVVSLYHLINYSLMLLYPGFDTRKHRRLVKEFSTVKKKPKVAVFIPAAGEDVGIVSQTARAASGIRYENFDVFVLDDSKDGIYASMAKEIGIGYIRRPEVGRHKKAGNLNYARGAIRGYSHILVLDADFVPRKEILRELVPYATRNVGIVQSPQHFHLSEEMYRHSKIEFGAGMIQRDFYRITQVARDRFGGAICVGTNALYSMKALEQVGGFEGVGPSDWGHSEDVNTGLKIINTHNQQGEQYQIRYIPVQLATGICPSDHLSFYKQQNRWATGSMQLIFSKKTIFSKTLSIPQKITYFSNSLYYFYTIGMLFAPVQLLILMLSPHTYNWSYTLLFIPMLFVSYILMPFLLRQKIEPIATSVVVISNAYTFAQAIWLLIIRRPLGWEATGARGGAKNRHTHFLWMKILSSIAFTVVYLLTLAVLAMNYRIGFNPSTFITAIFLLSFIGHTIYLHYLIGSGITFRKLHVTVNTYVYGVLACLVVLAVTPGIIHGRHYDIKYQPEQFALVVVRDEDNAERVDIGSVTVEPPKGSQDDALSTPSADKKPEESQEITVVVQEGDNQSEIASEIVTTTRSDIMIDDATAGKLQDQLMLKFGYNNVIHPGTTYVITIDGLRALIDDKAKVVSGEHVFWDQYAQDVGVDA